MDGIIHGTFEEVFFEQTMNKKLRLHKNKQIILL